MTAVIGRADSGEDYYVVIPEGEPCPPETPPAVPVVVCAPVPDGYTIPGPPAVPFDELGGYFVVHPTIIPDEGDTCPLPQDLGENVLGVLCGPAPKDFSLPRPPYFDTALCDEARMQLDAMKAKYAETHSDQEVAELFPDYLPETCQIIGTSADGTAHTVHFDPIDPTQAVLKVVVRDQEAQ